MVRFSRRELVAPRVPPFCGQLSLRIFRACQGTETAMLLFDYETDARKAFDTVAGGGIRVTGPGALPVTRVGHLRTGPLPLPR